MLCLFVLMAAFPCLNALGINTKTGNFPCNQCGRQFHDVTKSILHEQECKSPRCMEDVDVPVTADDVPFSCDDCGKTFPSLNSWVSHSQFNCPHTQSLELPITGRRNVNVSLPHDDTLFHCSSHNTSDGSRCSFSAPTRRLLELHMRKENHPFNCTHENCTSTHVDWKYDHLHYTRHLASPHDQSASKYSTQFSPHDTHASPLSETTHDGIFMCPSNGTSDEDRCNFQCRSRKILEAHMEEAHHPYNCPHPNCTSTGTVWRFRFPNFQAHIKTPHDEPSKRKQIDEQHHSNIPSTAPINMQRKSANTRASANESEAEESSDEESPDSPRVDNYHASIEEMVGVRINSTIPNNTDSSLTKVALDTASRLWHINMNERVCAVCDEHHVLKYMKSLTLTHPDGTFKGSELFSKMQVYNYIVFVNYSIF